MLPQINNIIDVIWLLLGAIAIGIVIYISLDWKLLYEGVLTVLMIICIALWFWMREAWKAIRRRFKKRSKWVHVDDHELFI